MSLNSAIEEYSKLCKLITLLDAPGKGGNISVKYNDILYGDMLLIKSSGQDMKSRHVATICYVKDGPLVSYDFKRECLISKLKPSMEVQMHLNLKAKYVFHYHPVYVLPYLCSTKFAPTYGRVINYVNPGPELAKAVIGVEEEVIWLKNHGVVIQSDSVDRVIDLYEQIKLQYFVEHLTPYTPDDVVDENNPELWLFRQYIELIAIREDMVLINIDRRDRAMLKSDPNEQYRME